MAGDKNSTERIEAGGQFSTSSTLCVTKVTKHYGSGPTHVVAVQDVSLDLAPGGRHCC